MLQKQNMSEAKTVLVTGGSGYIGGMVCQLLVAEGHNVINVDRKKREIPGVTLYPFDLDNSQIKGVIQLTKPDTIMHFAAEHEVARSMVEPDRYYWNNVGNTIALLNHAVEAGVKNFIFSSSSSVYGDIETFPTTEDSPKAPVSPYGRSKSIVEDMLQDYKNAFDLNYVALRYFNAAGAAPDNSHGYRQEVASHIVPIIARNILNQEVTQVFGMDYDTPDGTAIRDYTHVFDIATAHLASMHYLGDGGKSDIFNIGNGTGNSVKEVIGAFGEVTGTIPEHTFASRRAGDPPITHADNTKARELLGWSPVYGLNDIVEHALAWETKNFKVAK
tara:strand:+ start:16104 stop:17096 length:993 start_codon:yes stop_codon:yes gene_type:complete